MQKAQAGVLPDRAFIIKITDFPRTSRTCRIQGTPKAYDKT